MFSVDVLFKAMIGFTKALKSLWFWSFDLSILRKNIINIPECQFYFNIMDGFYTIIFIYSLTIICIIMYYIKYILYNSL